MSRYELLSLLLSAVGLVVSAAVLLLLVWQLRLLASQVKDSREAMDRATTEAVSENVRTLRRNTFSFIGTAMLRMHEVFVEVPAARGPLFEEFVAIANDPGSAEYLKLRRYLDLLEDLASGVLMEVFDADLVWHILGTRMLNAWNLAGTWIGRERRRLDHPTLFEDIEACARTFQRKYPAEAARKLSNASSSSTSG